MNSYELYNKVLASVNMDEGTFNAAARNWVEGCDNAPFEDEEASDLFNTAKMACAAWRNKAINGRVSKIRMIECVRKIAAKNLSNPYDPNEKEKEVPVKTEPIHVLGVIPEDNKESVTETQVNVNAKQEIAEKNYTDKTEKQEEPKEEKRIFGKRKNR